MEVDPLLLLDVVLEYLLALGLVDLNDVQEVVPPHGRQHVLDVVEPEDCLQHGVAVAFALHDKRGLQG